MWRDISIVLVNRRATVCSSSQAYLSVFFMFCLTDCRRSDLIEGLICEYQGGINGVDSQNDTDSKEGAKLFKLLESAAEPDFLMADMSMEELNCFNRYKEKFEVEYCESFLTGRFSSKLK